jgi:hypothetical protein
MVETLAPRPVHVAPNAANVGVIRFTAHIGRVIVLVRHLVTIDRWHATTLRALGFRRLVVVGLGSWHQFGHVTGKHHVKNHLSSW